MSQFGPARVPRCSAQLAACRIAHKEVIFVFPARRNRFVSVSLLTLAGFLYFLPGCSSSNPSGVPDPIASPSLTQDEVLTLVTQAVEQAERQNQKAVVAVTDRAGNVLAVFSMNGTRGSVWDVNVGAVSKARTAAYLSSNQHAFTTLTACFITRSHFPPGVSNTPGGPLYGVPFSSLGGGDVQPNGSVPQGQAGNGQQGLTGVPGGVPVYKNGLLAGALGISSFGTVGLLPGNFLTDCTGTIPDESIALGAVVGFAVSGDRRGDNVLLDGIRLLYANLPAPQGNFAFTADSLAGRGSFDSTYPLPNPVTFPIQGAVDLGDGLHNYMARAGQFLTAGDVQQIIDQAVSQAGLTRAAIRRPIGSAARVFVSVVDIDGSVLGVWRTPDATLFSYDVSVQKARTVVAFSDSSATLGQQIRQVLGLAVTQQLAVTTRAVGFLSQRFFPPGIDQSTLGRPVQPGPLYVPDPILPGNDFRWQQNLALAPFGNGITIFPGGIPLYRNGRLIGGIGVSGDGVDQDDFIAAAGAKGFEPPANIRCDLFSYDGVRLPYVKFPRQPLID